MLTEEAVNADLGEKGTQTSSATDNGHIVVLSLKEARTKLSRLAQSDVPFPNRAASRWQLAAVTCDVRIARHIHSSSSSLSNAVK